MQLTQLKPIGIGALLIVGIIGIGMLSFAVMPTLYENYKDEVWYPITAYLPVFGLVIIIAIAYFLALGKRKHIANSTHNQKQ